MDTGNVDEQRERAELSASAAPTSVAGSSPLSELPEDPQVDDEATIYAGSAADDNDEAVTDDDEANEQSSNEAFRCEYCGKAYQNQKSLKGHLREKRTKCAKRRADAQSGALMYSCSRCHAQMSKRYSVERHIKESCWKICDECVEAGNPACNASHTEDQCSLCVEQGQHSCTKYLGPVPNSVAKPLTAASATHATTTSTMKREKGKRKAVASPDASPEATHAVKRPAPTIKQESTECPYVYRPQPPGNNVTLEAWMRDRQDLPTVNANTTYQQPTYLRSTTGPPRSMATAPQHNQRPQQPQGLYADPGRVLPSTAQMPQIQHLQQGQTRGMYNGPERILPSTVQMPRMPQMQYPQQGQSRGLYNDPGRVLPSTTQLPQMQHLQQGRGVAPQIAYPSISGSNAYGIQSHHQPGPDYTPNASTKALTDLLRYQQQQLLNMANGIHPNIGYPVPQPLHRPQPTLLPKPVAETYRTNFNNLHPPEACLSRFRPAQGNYAPGAPRTDAFIASAPGSRMPSRQSSIELAKDSRAKSCMPPSEQLQDMNKPKTITNKHVAQELTEQIAYCPSESPVVDENSPILRIQIHSNTYDPNGTPIFSILTIRASQKFGPRLDAYCQQRDKQYGQDWVFVYQYALGRKGGGERERYIKVTYDMTPEDVHDVEMPHVKLRDMDTISVMKAKHYATMDVNNKNGMKTPLSPVGSQVSEADVEITHGETRVYQNAGTINKWQALCENKMREMQARMTQLDTIVKLQKQKLVKQEMALAVRETRNMDATTSILRAQAAGRAQPARQPFAQQAQPFTNGNLGGRTQEEVRAYVAAGYEAMLAREAAERNATQQKMARQHQLYQQQSKAQQERQMLDQHMKELLQQDQMRRQQMARQQTQQFRFPGPNGGDRRPTYTSGPQEPFPNFVDPDGLPLFQGQDNPPPGFQSPLYAGFAPADGMLQRVPLSAQAQGGFWKGLPSQHNMPQNMRRDAPVSEAGSRVEVSKTDDENDDSVMGDE